MSLMPGWDSATNGLTPLAFRDEVPETKANKHGPYARTPPAPAAATLQRLGSLPLPSRQAGSGALSPLGSPPLSRTTSAMKDHGSAPSGGLHANWWHRLSSGRLNEMVVEDSNAGADGVATITLQGPSTGYRVPPRLYDLMPEKAAEQLLSAAGGLL